MMSKRASIAAGLAAASLFTAVPRAQAGPTVIRSEMLQDTAVTPVLGRGYSLATNTFQSICLVDVPKTKPSYDFHYNFEDIDNTGMTKRDVTAKVKGSFVKYDGGFFDVDVSGDLKYVDNEKRTWFKHHIVVSIDIAAYYASVDEGKARMADAPSELLKNNDVPGFFDGCGLYYTRSISRKSSFDSIFTYESLDAERDQQFEMHLKSVIKAFGQEVSNLQTDVDTKFRNEIKEKRTTIVSHGFGLAKDDKADLISYNLETFRAAIKSAFVSMQNDDVGMVTAIEVVPWVENPQFQALLKLPPREIDKPGGQPGEKITVSPYAQKRILSQNAEFMSELDRAARAKLNVFYKAKQCRAQTNFDFMEPDDQGTWKFGPVNPLKPEDGDWSTRQIINNRTQADPISLAQLYATMTDDKLALIFAEYESFLYGGADPAVGVDDPARRKEAARAAFTSGKYPVDLFPGVVTCVSDLLSDGFTTRSYRKIPSCERVEETFAVISGQAIDDYCMPTLVK
jgi:hypothetical protein